MIRFSESLVYHAPMTIVSHPSMLKRMRWCVALALAASAEAAEETVCVDNAAISDLQEALAAGRTTSADLVRAYMARIAAYDGAGPALNSVREVNPDALGTAEKLGS